MLTVELVVQVRQEIIHKASLSVRIYSISNLNLVFELLAVLPPMWEITDLFFVQYPGNRNVFRGFALPFQRKWITLLQKETNLLSFPSLQIHHLQLPLRLNSV